MTLSRDSYGNATPRTDKLIAEFRPGSLDFAWTLVDLCRELERKCGPNGEVQNLCESWLAAPYDAKMFQNTAGEALQAAMRLDATGTPQEKA
jgi:hypothetical protein